jgi:predicted permease
LGGPCPFPNDLFDCEQSKQAPVRSISFACNISTPVSSGHWHAQTFVGAGRLTMFRDLRFAIRQLRKSPGFTLTAVLTLALGIGANTAIFTLVDSMLLHPLPFAQQNELVKIGNGQSDSDGFYPKGWIRALGEHLTSLEAISGFGPDVEANIGEANSSARVFGAEVMTNALDTLGVHPALGRFFSPADAQTGADPVVVLSHGYWRERFGANPNTINSTVRIDGIPRRVIGVMPAGVRFPYGDTQFVTPITFKGGDPLEAWKIFDLRAFGRLRHGVTPAQAQADLHRIHPSLLPLFPWRMPDAWAKDTVVVPLLESEVGAVRPRLLLLFSAVGLILLIACANVANMTLARAAGREREIAVRSALGASGARLLRQLLSESVVLGVAAGAVGLMTAAVSLHALVRLLPPDTPRLEDVSLRWPVLLFGAAVSIVSGILFGLIPAVRLMSPNLRESLHSGSRSVAGKAGQFRASMMLVMAQISLSVVVITAAGLMLHSLWSLSQVDPGFRTDRIVTAELSLDSTACQTKGRCQQFFDTLLDHMKGLAGAENVALTDTLPLGGDKGSFVYDAEGHPRDARQEAMLATSRIVSPDYFGTLGVGLLRGRLLTQQDMAGTSRAAVINQEMANRLWPQQDPLGKHINNVRNEEQPGVWKIADGSVIVGVVSNTREGGLAEGFGDQVYLPMTPANEQPVMYVLLRTRASTQQAAAELHQVVAALDAEVPITGVRTLNEVVTASESAPRSLTILLLAFGALAVVIGAVGVYSLIAYIVSWRVREFGIRIALGAQRWQILSGVLRQSLLLAMVGSAMGLAASALVARAMRAFLFQVKTIDPITFGAVTLLMIVLTLLAAWVPARRAANVDPMRSLRME